MFVFFSYGIVGQPAFLANMWVFLGGWGEKQKQLDGRFRPCPLWGDSPHDLALVSLPAIVTSVGKEVYWVSLAVSAN